VGLVNRTIPTQPYPKGEIVGWDMAKHMHLQVQEKKREVMQATKFFYVTCDEVTTLDNGTWISIHVYVVVGFEWFPMLVALEHIDDGTTSNNLTKVIMASIQEISGLEREEVAARMMCFGVGTTF
jgi:hypothetical protein